MAQERALACEEQQRLWKGLCGQPRTQSSPPALVGGGTGGVHTTLS